MRRDYKKLKNNYELRITHYALILALSFVFLFSTESFAEEKTEKIEENRAYFPPVLMYHDIKIKARDKFDVLIEDFCAQLDWLKENNYKTLSMEEFVSYVKNQKKFPEKSILITFDDGYSGIFNHAVAELKKHEMEATFFIHTNLIGVFDTRYAHITEKQLAALAKDKLFSIESHSLSHSKLLDMGDETLEDELEDSKEFLEKITGKKVLAFAYPYGEYNEEIINEVKEAGYEVAFAVDNGPLCNQPARFSIPRIYMGLDLCENNQELFKNYVQNYKNMPPEAFAERYQPLSEDLHWLNK